MSFLIRSIGARAINTFIRQPRKHQLSCFIGSARFSTILPPSGNTYGHPETPNGKRIIALGSVLAIGTGLAYGYKKVFTTEGRVANCAEKDECGCEKPIVECEGEGEIVESECEDAESQCKDSACLHKLDEEEQNIIQANQELEKALREIKPMAVEFTELAIEAYSQAAEIIKVYMDKIYSAMENDDLYAPEFDEVWCEIYDLALERCEKASDAMQKGQCAWELLCKLRDIIENGKNCKYSSCNPLLITSQETHLCAERELLNARAKMDCVQSESRLVEEYRNVVEEFRKELKAEMPPVSTASPECPNPNDENECEMILTQAYKKVVRIQKELALVQVGMGKVPAPQAKTLC